MSDSLSSPGPSATSTEKQPDSGRARRVLKWIVLAAALLFFFAVVRQAVDPFGDQPYVEVTHGDHTHYVPKDRDPKVPIGKFPTRAPGPNERITPEGRIVARQ